jgi:carboxyl-terminal processing protease
MGDYISSIDGVSTYGIGEEEYDSLVTKTKITNIHVKVKQGGNGADFDIPLKRVISKSVLVREMSDFNSTSQKFDSADVGYIQISVFSKNTAKEFSDAISTLKSSGKKRLILDLRGNTGGYVDEAIDVCKQIVPKGPIISTKSKNGTVTTYSSDLSKTPFEKCVILVDSNTASASEIVASAMQDSGAGIIVGEQTFGKGVMQSVMDFESLGVLKMTTLEYTSRLGKTINGVGVTPDVSVDKVLFIEETDSLDSSKVISAIRFLGYRVDENNTVARNIGKYQAELGIPVTYKLNAATVSAINMEIYDKLTENDRILSAGYLSLLS